MSIGFVRVLSFVSLRQSRDIFVDGLKILLCIFLGSVFSRSLYFVMAFLKLMAVCLVEILLASTFARHPIVASSLIHFFTIVSLVGLGGTTVFFSVYNCCISGWFGQFARGMEYVVHMAFLVLWWVWR